MIEKTYPSKRAKPLPAWQQKPVHQPKQIDGRDVARAAHFGITPEEFLRRDKIVRQLFSECPWHVGQKLWPKTPEEEKDYGQCEVRMVYKSYHDFEVEDAKRWPKDDKPLILTVEPTKGEYTIICCNSEWLQKDSHQPQTCGATC